MFLFSPIRHTVLAIEALHTEIAELDKAHDLARKELVKKLERIQSQCRHQVKDYHPDASGNNDSWYSCQICGKDDV